MTNHSWSIEEIQLLKDVYPTQQVKETLKLFPGRTEISLWKKAQRLGIRTPISTYSYNREFFKVPNLLNSYWAGFIAADGCIMNGGRSGVDITLQAKDKDHLETFKRDTDYSGDVKDTTKSGYPSVRISVCCREWSKDLNDNYNVTPKKSLTLQPPNITDFEMKLAFINGYIDGDGCISKKTGRSTFTLNVLGTEAFLDWMKSVFCEIPEFNPMARVLPRKGTNVYTYNVSYKYFMLIYDQIMKLDVPRMQRKWGKIDKI